MARSDYYSMVGDPTRQDNSTTHTNQKQKKRYRLSTAPYVPNFWAPLCASAEFVDCNPVDLKINHYINVPSFLRKTFQAEKMQFDGKKSPAVPRGT